MAAAKTERLLTLMNALLGAPRGITAAQLHSRVPGYPEGDASFHRAFERDKEELRAMGVELLVEPVPGTDPPATGYRIRPQDYELGDPGLEPDELEALNLAAAVVGLDSGAGQLGLLKLGGEAVTDAPRAELPADPDLVAAFTGVARRQPVTFGYRGTSRAVDPYRLTFARGRWYLQGYDHVREAVRWYRLGRVDDAITLTGEPGRFERPADLGSDLRLDPWVQGDTDPVEATVWFDPAVAPAVRAEVGEQRVVRDDPDGLVVSMRVTNPDGFRSWLVAFLDRAEVLEPPELRDAVVEWLEHVASGAST